MKTLHLKIWQVITIYYFVWTLLLGATYLTGKSIFSYLLISLFYVILLKLTEQVFTLPIPSADLTRYFHEIGSNPILISIAISLLAAFFFWWWNTDITLLAGAISLAIYFGEKYLISITLEKESAQ